MISCDAAKMSADDHLYLKLYDQLNIEAPCIQLRSISPCLQAYASEVARCGNLTVRQIQRLNQAKYCISWQTNVQTTAPAIESSR